MGLSREARLITLLCIDVVFFFVEIIVGYASGSLALVADALHMLNDVMSLIVALYALKLSTQSNDSTQRDPKFSYGWQRAEILGALINGVFLLALCFTIFMEALQRLFDPSEVKNPKLVIIVGAFGLASNIVGLFLFHDHGHSHGGHSHGGHSHGPAAHSHAPKKINCDSAADVGASTSSDGAADDEDEPSSSARQRGESVSSLLGHPAQTRAYVVRTAHDLGYEDRRGGVSIQGGERYAPLPGHSHDVEAGADAEHDHDHEGHDHDDAAAPKKGFFGKLFAGHDHGSGGGHSHGGHSHGDGSMNMQGVFLHVLGDALGNVGVIAAGCIIAFTTYSWRFYSDPLISFVITVIIFHSALPLVKSASFILLQGVPHTIPFEEVRESILSVDGVISAHDLHIWALSESKTVASVHVLVNCGPGQDERYMQIAAEIRAKLHQYAIHSVTIQPEFIRGGIKEAARLSGVAATDRRDADGNLVTEEGVPVETEVSRIETACLITCGPDASCAQDACCPPSISRVPTPVNGESAARSVHSAHGDHDDHDHAHEATALLSNGSAPQRTGIAGAWDRSRDFFTSAVRRGKRRSHDDEDGAAEPAPRRTLSQRFASFKARHPVLLAILIVLALIFLFGLIIFGVLAAHLSGTLKTPSPDVQARILDESLLLKGPDRISLLNISDDGISVRFDGRLGVDPEQALDLWLGKRSELNWWKRRERDWVEWAVAKVGGVRVELGELKISEPDWSLNLDETELGILGASKDPQPVHPPKDLLSFHVQPLIVPLPPLDALRRMAEEPPIFGNHSTDRAAASLQPLNLTLLLKPVSPVPYIAAFAQEAVKKGRGTVDIRVESLRVRGIARKDMAKGIARGGLSVPGLINIGAKDLRKRMSQKVPRVGKDPIGDDFLNLTRYDFFEIGATAGKSAVSALFESALGIRAWAEAKNPLGKKLSGHVTYSLPFGVYLPIGELGKDGKPRDSSLLAAVATEPFDLVGQKKIPLTLQGRVVRPSQAGAQVHPNVVAHHKGSGQSSFGVGANTHDVSIKEETPDQAALSNFLSRFLRGEPNTVFVRGGSPFPPGSEGPFGTPGTGSKLPSWLESGLRMLDVPISFPGNKVTDLLQNVTISDLKITPHPFEKEKLLCSGTVMGVMALPGDLAAVDIAINQLWPDIIVFDGKPPGLKHGHHGGGGNDDDDDGDKLMVGDGEDQPDPLPDPLPKNAFGRVRPHNWTAAETFIDPTDPLGQRKLLRSELKDVPFTVLPGRGAVFRGFTWKLIGGKGTLAGIEGKAKATIFNSGLGNLELTNLPVVGAFEVGKRGDGDGDEPGDEPPFGAKAKGAGRETGDEWSRGLDDVIERAKALYADRRR